jgi:chromosome segregation ATPase
MTTTESYGCDKHGEEAYQGCAMCDLETLRERLHEAELVAASWKREAELNEQAANESSGYAKRLAEAEAENARLVAANKARDEFLRGHRYKHSEVDGYINLCESQMATLKARLAEADRDMDQLIGERDHAQGMADKLADAIATLLGVEIGEHSNMNCPWEQALEAFEERAASTVTQDAAP